MNVDFLQRNRIATISLAGTVALMSILGNIASAFSVSRFAPSRTQGAKAPDPQDEIRELRKSVKEKTRKRKELQLRNRLAREESLLLKLESHGRPAERDLQRREQVARPQKPVTIHEPSYSVDSITGYPFVPSVTEWDVKPTNTNKTRFEQDPLFGWGGNQFAFGFDALGELSTNVPSGSFPREMFPERPATLRTQISQDAMRFQSRAWYEIHPQYAGCCGHLVNYTIGTGLTFDVVSDVDKQLAQDVMDYLTAFSTYRWNNLKKRPKQSAINILRDGEDALRLVPGDGEYPEIRVVDTSWIRGPHNEITGPWSMGVLTSWPRCYDDVRAYNVWYPDNTQEIVSPDVMNLAKAPTLASNIKRGIPLSYKIRKALPQISNLVDCMAIGEAVRQGIPYIVQYAMADKNAVKSAINAHLDDYSPELYGDRHGYGYGGQRGQEPGVVHHINQKQEMKDPPNAQGFAASGTAVYRTLCESCACATNTPIWFWTGSADAENYSSSLVSESPVVKEVQSLQGEIIDHYEFILTAAVFMGIVQGRFPSNVFDIVKIHCTLPTPVARNRKEEVDTDLRLLDKGLLAPQQVCKRNDIDFQEARELIDQAEADGWQNQMGIQPGERPIGQEGAEGETAAETGNEQKRLEQLRFESKDSSGHEHEGAGSSKGGQFVSTGSGGTGKEKQSGKPNASGNDANEKKPKISERAARAIASHNPSTKEKQRESDRFESKLATAIGAKRSDDNRPMDNFVNDKHGIELKVMHDQKGLGRVNMRPDSRERKEAWVAAEKGRTGHVVLIDNRDKFDGGKFKDSYSGHHIYYRDAIGAWSSSTMTKVKNYKDLKALILGDKATKKKYGL